MNDADIKSDTYFTNLNNLFNKPICICGEK